eukprot:scaffold49220_cov57-Phaeocystis_antarctica.AAC.1
MSSSSSSPPKARVGCGGWLAPAIGLVVPMAHTWSLCAWSASRLRRLARTGHTLGDIHGARLELVRLEVARLEVQRLFSVSRYPISSVSPRRNAGALLLLLLPAHYDSTRRQGHQENRDNNNGDDKKHIVVARRRRRRRLGRRRRRQRRRHRALFALAREEDDNDGGGGEDEEDVHGQAQERLRLDNAAPPAPHAARMHQEEDDTVGDQTDTYHRCLCPRRSVAPPDWLPPRRHRGCSRHRRRRPSRQHSCHRCRRRHCPRHSVADWLRARLARGLRGRMLLVAELH